MTSGPYPVRTGADRGPRRAYVAHLTSQQVGAYVGMAALLVVVAFIAGYAAGRRGAPGRAEAEAEAPEAPPPTPAVEAVVEEAAVEPQPVAPPRPRPAPPEAPAPEAPPPAESPRRAAPDDWVLKRWAIVARSIPLPDTPAQAARARDEARRVVRDLRAKGYLSARSEEVTLDSGRFIRVVARDITPAGPGILEENVRKVRSDGYPGAFPIAH